VIDDVSPVSWASSSREQHQSSARIVRKLMRDNRQHRMGDVYKCVFAIHDFYPQFNYATFEGHGQTVIWKETRDNFSPTFDDLSKISRLSYKDFLRHRDDHFNVAGEEELLQLVTSKIVH
jgi:hypothetical protein